MSEPYYVQRKQIRFYTTPGCPYCKPIGVLLQQIIKDDPDFKMTSIPFGTAQYWEDVARYKIMSVPAVVVNDKLAMQAKEANKMNKEILRSKLLMASSQPHRSDNSFIFGRCRVK